MRIVSHLSSKLYLNDVLEYTLNRSECTEVSKYYFSEIVLMKREKENNHHLTMELKSLLGKMKENKPRIKFIIDGQGHSGSNEEKQKEINKEIIRRLRIQNKKLLEQVIKLKEEIKKSRFNKNQVLSHINELLKLINR